MDKDNKNLIIADFKTAVDKPSEIHNVPKDKQTNPIVNRLFKLTHKNLGIEKDDYKSFSNFRPEDLR